MNILVVNDDGIRSPGLQYLVNALATRGDVYVTAPKHQRSGASQAISLTETIYIVPMEIPNAQMAYEVDGTPADCTKVGLQFFEREGIQMDMVYSGINFGSNLGEDTLYSGTVGAATEGALSGIHSVAVSLDSHTPTHFDVACELAVDVMDFVLNETGTDTVININVPDLPREEVKGLRVTRLGGRYYADYFVPGEDGGYHMEGKPDPVTDAPDLDVTALAEGYASISPIRVDHTHYAMVERLETAGLKLREKE